jgi:endoglucanase
MSVIAAAALVVVLLASTVVRSGVLRSAASAPQLRVVGSRLLGPDNKQVILHGVDRSGTEYACVSGLGIFSGPTNEASVRAMKSWGVDAVRLPLNEACWNGESYVNPKYAGRNYRLAVDKYVKLLIANGMIVIVDLHWTDGRYTGRSSGCSSALAVCQKPMPDAAESIPFWTSVASTFRDNKNVIFDLFNEPFPDRALRSPTAAWQCWLRGGRYCSAGIHYPVAGMQTLVNTVRATGANNVIMLGGLNDSTDLTGWLRYEPDDPDRDLVVSWHSYKSTSCSAEKCWNAQVLPVIAQVPVIVDEIGEHDCHSDYVRPLMRWLDRHKTGYLAWSWNATSSCDASSKLIKNWSGSPTVYGAAVEAHLRALAAASS